MVKMPFIIFFKEKTAYNMRISDWSSDVCSADLRFEPLAVDGDGQVERLRREVRGESIGQPQLSRQLRPEQTGARYPQGHIGVGAGYGLDPLVRLKIG